MKKTKFSLLLFLASLGSGGITIIPFAFLQYIYPHGPGLVKLSDIAHSSLPFWDNLFYFSLEAVMLIFTVIHFILSAIFVKKLIPFLKSKNYKKLLNDPLKNSSLMAPFISLVMTMNVFIGPIRFFVAPMANNLQQFMLPALIIWIVIFFFLLKMEIILLKKSFEKGFDVSKINFGWLLHPFALAMLTVTGTGIAAMAKSPDIAHTAAFLSFISGGMGLFLFMVKLNSLFQKHFNSREGLGDKKFLPGFLIVIPNITLYAISAFRISHYLEHHHAMHMGSFPLLVTTLAFAFETWYLVFGMSLLGGYLKNHHFKKEFYPTQWGLVCPFVAYGVLGSFLYSTFVPSKFFIATTILSMIIAIYIFTDLLIRNMKCAKLIGGKIKCDN